MPCDRLSPEAYRLHTLVGKEKDSVVPNASIAGYVDLKTMQFNPNPNYSPMSVPLPTMGRSVSEIRKQEAKENARRRQEERKNQPLQPQQPTQPITDEDDVW